MASLTDFLPIFQETAASIRARIDADANAGLTEDDPRYLDLREGGFFHDITEPVVQELGRLWDALSLEVPAAAFPQFSWGEFLDYHAAKFFEVRKPAVRAQGTLTFVGEPGTFVAAGVIVAADPADDDTEAIEFETTASGTTGAGLAEPTGLTGTPSTGGGTLQEGDYTYVVTAINEFGETPGSLAIEVTTTGTTSSVALNWDDVAGATGYRVYRDDDINDSVRVAQTVASDYTDTGTYLLEGAAPGENSTAGVTLAAQAVEPGTAGNVAALAADSILTPLAGITSATNRDAFIGGTEEESDQQLQDRILLLYQGAGGGNINDYRRWALQEEGVGRVYVNALASGPGTVEVVVMTEDGDPVPQAVVDSLQDRLDPVPGKGEGLAPIGAVVTVSTPEALTVDVWATIEFSPGFNLDGTGGQIGLRGRIEAALAEYLDALTVGEDVIYQHVIAQFFRVRGVYNVSNVQIDAGDGPVTTDIAVDAVPPQVAQFGVANLA